MTIFFLFRICRITSYLEVAEIKLLLEPSGNYTATELACALINNVKQDVCLSVWPFTKGLHVDTDSNLFIGVLIAGPGAILKLRNEYDLFVNNLKQNFFSDSLEIKQTNKNLNELSFLRNEPSWWRYRKDRSSWEVFSWRKTLPCLWISIMLPQETNAKRTAKRQILC